MSDNPTYHDVHIQTAQIERTSISNLPYYYKLMCTRTGGWELFKGDELVAGEYDKVGIRVDVNGLIIADNLIKNSEYPDSSSVEFRRGVRAFFDHLLMRTANNWHGNPDVQAQCDAENAIIEEWAKETLEQVSLEDHIEWVTVSEALKEKEAFAKAALTRQQVQIEKLLCSKLGRVWQPNAGDTIDSMIDELAATHALVAQMSGDAVQYSDSGKRFASDGVTPTFSMHGVGIMVRAADFNKLLAASRISNATVPPEFDVRKILLDVVPGDDGMGEEVYAKNVADIERVLTDMGQRLEDYQLKTNAAGQDAPRFYIDHGLWHDRESGQHMYTQDQYDELRRDAFHNGYAAGKDEVIAANSAAPDRWKLVPTEPTIEMVMTGEKVWNDQLDKRLDDSDRQGYPSEKNVELCARVAYRAMLNAAPSAFAAIDVRDAAVKPWIERAKEAGDFPVLSGDKAATYMAQEIEDWRALQSIPKTSEVESTNNGKELES